MYDPVTLDQLRALVAVVDEGSFSAAARKLKRVQSAISTAMANLEDHLGLPLFDRATKVATLTEQGRAVVASARRVLGEVDALRKMTAGLVTGIEASVSLCVDALFPIGALVELCGDFAHAFPSVDLRIDTQVMSGVSERVLSGAATLGVVSPGGLGDRAGLERTPLAAVRMVTVVAPSHSLAAQKRPEKAQLADAIQIVLSERSDSPTADQAVLGLRTWRVADLHTKHMLLRAGLGWGNLPAHLVHDDVRTKRLVVLRPRAWAEDEHTLHLSIIHRADALFGPAHRWIVERIGILCARHAGPASSSRRSPNG